MRPEKEGIFTLADAKLLYKSCDYYSGKLATFKTDLQKLLKTTCHEQCRKNGSRYKYAFLGFNLITTTEDTIDPLD